MTKEKIRIGSRSLGENEPCYVIAEIGINHNGSMELAKRLIDAAVDAGADAVKFQKRTITVVYTPEELQKPREVPREIIESALKRGVLPAENVKRLQADMQSTTNGDLKWALEFSEKEYAEIDAYCKSKNIAWFASPWDEASVDFLEKLNVPAYKVASASLTDEALLRRMRDTGKPVILSTGMSTMAQVDAAVKVLGKDKLLIMHCVSTYPAELEQLNLKGIQTLKDAYPDVLIGYSGHEKGVYMSLCAAVLGAVSVERHLTLDRSMWGSDQAASLEPKGMELLVGEIRNYEKAKGDGVKKILPEEEPILNKIRSKNTLDALRKTFAPSPAKW